MPTWNNSQVTADYLSWYDYYIVTAYTLAHVKSEKRTFLNENT